MRFSDIQAERELLALQYLLLGGGFAVLFGALAVYFLVRSRRLLVVAGSSMIVGLLLMAGGFVTGQMGQTRTYESTDRLFQEALLEMYGMKAEMSLSMMIAGSDDNGEANVFVDVKGERVPVTFVFDGDVIGLRDKAGEPIKAL